MSEAEHIEFLIGEMSAVQDRISAIKAELATLLLRMPPTERCQDVPPRPLKPPTRSLYKELSIRLPSFRMAEFTTSDVWAYIQLTRPTASRAYVKNVLWRMADKGHLTALTQGPGRETIYRRKGPIEPTEKYQSMETSLDNPIQPG